MYINQVSINNNIYCPNITRKPSFQSDNVRYANFSYNNSKSNQAILNSGRAIVFKGKKKKEFIPEFPKPTVPTKISVSEQKKLLEGGTKYSYTYIGKIQDDGTFVFYNKHSGLFGIEKPADNPYGYETLVRYKDGELSSEIVVTKNDDGSYTRSRTYYEDGKPDLHCIETQKKWLESSASIKMNDGKPVYTLSEDYYSKGNPVKCVTETVGQLGEGPDSEKMLVKTKVTEFNDRESSIYEIPSEYEIHEYEYSDGTKMTELQKFNKYTYVRGVITENDKGCNYSLDHETSTKEEIERAFNLDKIENYKPDSSEILSQDIPDGYYLDSENNKLIKINKEDLRVVTDGLYIRVLDKEGHILGEAQCSCREDNYHFDCFSSAVNGLGIGTLILDEIKKKAEKNNMGITALADSGYDGIEGAQKKYKNLAFYYKMGYRAQDAGADKLIQECIDRGFEIPNTLNMMRPIRYVGKNSPLGSGAQPITVPEIKKRQSQKLY